MKCLSMKYETHFTEQLVTWEVNTVGNEIWLIYVIFQKKKKKKIKKIL